MDKDKKQEMFDSIVTLTKIMMIMYKMMRKNGFDTGEAVVLAQSLIEVILGQNNG